MRLRAGRVRLMPDSFVAHSINELQRELDLARVAGGFADFAKPGPGYDIRGQTHIDNVEEVEELRAELEIDQLDSALARAEGRVLD